MGQRRLILEGLDPDSESTPKERADALAAIVVAFSDGLAMQYLADPTGIDLDRIFAVWNEMIEEASTPPTPADLSGSERDGDSSVESADPGGTQIP